MNLKMSIHFINSLFKFESQKINENFNVIKKNKKGIVIIEKHKNINRSPYFIKDYTQLNRANYFTYSQI